MAALHADEVADLAKTLRRRISAVVPLSGDPLGGAGDAAGTEAGEVRPEASGAAGCRSVPCSCCPDVEALSVCTACPLREGNCMQEGSGGWYVSCAALQCLLDGEALVTRLLPAGPAWEAVREVAAAVLGPERPHAGHEVRLAGQVAAWPAAPCPSAASRDSGQPTSWCTDTSQPLTQAVGVPGCRDCCEPSALRTPAAPGFALRL